ncbi:MAG: hypothetical protein ACJAVI_001513 [Candidatus Azotimanducaceae bacterium]|jgi:hypothetical protein
MKLNTIRWASERLAAMPNNEDPHDKALDKDLSNEKVLADEKVSDEHQRTLPSQIPLLEDVISNLTVKTESANKTAVKKKKATPDIDPLDKPLAMDLFGDPIHSYAVHTENTHYIDPDELHSQATQVVNSLVKEYSHEIVRRLRNELTSVLNDLTEEKNSLQAPTRKPRNPHPKHEPEQDSEQNQKQEPDQESP